LNYDKIERKLQSNLSISNSTPYLEALEFHLYFGDPNRDRSEHQPCLHFGVVRLENGVAQFSLGAVQLGKWDSFGSKRAVRLGNWSWKWSCNCILQQTKLLKYSCNSISQLHCPNKTAPISFFPNYFQDQDNRNQKVIKTKIDRIKIVSDRAIKNTIYWKKKI